MMFLRSTGRFRRLSFSWISVAFVLPVFSAFAADEYDIDMALLRELNRLEMFEYSRLQISILEKRYPEKKDSILLEKARTLYMCGKSKDADKAIKEISTDSPAYNDSLLLIGEVSTRRKNFDEAAKAFSTFFKRVKPPKGSNDDEVESFKRAIAVYSHVLKQQGKATEAAKIIGLLGEISGGEGASDRQMGFLKAQAVLDAEEEKLSDRKPINRNGVLQAVKNLKQLQFVRDGVAAAAYVETARASVLLGGDKLNELKRAKKDAEITKIKDFIEAIKTLKMASEFLEEIEQTAIKGNDKSGSPLAGAMFYKGRALWGEAFITLQEGDADKARKLVEAAAKYYETVAVEYGESPYRMKALNEHSKCSAFLEKQFGEKIELTQANVEAELDLKLEQATAMLQNKNYAGAADIYLQAVRVGRRSKRLPDVVMRLIVCYGNMEHFWEAEALASYLGDVLPQSEGTAECLFRLGAVIYEYAKKETSKEARDQLMLRAMDSWEAFVDLAPAHPKAADVSFVIAEHYYKIASEKAKEASQAKIGEDQEKLKAEARERYLNAIPKYQRLVDRYSTYEKGIRSLYKLGWIYYSTDQPKQAVDAFLRYCESETLAKYSDDRLESKFRAAEQMMLGDAPAEAVDQFAELIGWLDPDSDKGFNVNSSTAKRIREDAACYYAWSYDLAAEDFRPKLTDFRSAITDQKASIKDAEKRIALNEERLATLETSRKETDADFQEMESKYGRIDIDFSARALAQAKKQAEDTSAMTDEERARTEANIQIQAKRLEGELLKQVQGEILGERLTREGERDDIKAMKDKNAARIETLQESLNTVAEKAETSAAAREKTEGELLELRNALSQTEEAVITEEAAAQDLTDKLEQIKEYELRADTDRKKQAVAEARKKVATSLHDAQTRLAEAHEKRNAIATPETEKKLALLEQNLAKARVEAEKDSTQLKKVKQEKAVVEKEGELLQARLVAVAKSLEFNHEFEKVISKTPEESAPLVADLQGLGLEVLELFRKARDLRVEKLVMLQNNARNTIATDREKIEEANAKITEIEEQMAPVKAEFEQWKRKAEASFDDFLKRYPKSTHVPDNMSRLGTIYLELEEFDKAASTLKKLAASYPDSTAAKMALFNLGRAQYEDGKFKDAASTFEQLLKNADEVPSINLGYISERMLEVNFPAVSLLASQELIKRSADANHEDYESLRERVRENALFRGGKASRLVGKLDEALGYFETLLKENSNSAYYFETKFEMALVKRAQDPPDISGAANDLEEVLQYADTQILSNRGLARLGETLAMDSSRESAEKAAARLQQVVMLADPAVEGNRPWIELAVFESAKVFARLGDQEQRDKMVAMYKEEFPNGKFAKEIAEIPAASPLPKQPGNEAATAAE